MRYLKNVTFKSVMIATFISLGLTSCSDDDSETATGGSANLTVRMTDAPGDFDAVFVDVEDIEIQVQSENEMDAEADVDGDGWVSVGDVQTGVYDLLELTGGVSQLLADTEVPAGYVSQMRLILGSENTVIVDGVEQPLNTPSAEQSGLKLQLNQDFEEGENYAFLLDFDVDKSIVATGNGGFNLKPVIRLSAEADAGVVVGAIVLPADLEMSVQSLVVLTGESTTVSAYTDEEGNFSLNGVPAGVYSLEVIPEADANLDTYAIGTVEVKPNETTDLGELSL
ncbi:DUF4382 domain-containing protein [Gramella lutea]|uniref:DUF4382 domain-containing protein n=1 Tax=Christiangramia lutea TaxID=1607951 RepID=A0A9X1V1B0_9FLAO|nr:DUF4382 domain-containing protein [Christiangramia lutea]MCH4822348.1 DUF4382 domain-containing protein [Christiangramia lutea]